MLHRHECFASSNMECSRTQKPHFTISNIPYHNSSPRSHATNKAFLGPPAFASESLAFVAIFIRSGTKRAIWRTPNTPVAVFEQIIAKRSQRTPAHTLSFRCFPEEIQMTIIAAPLGFTPHFACTTFTSIPYRSSSSTFKAASSSGEVARTPPVASPYGLVGIRSKRVDGRQSLEFEFFVGLMP
jgi:hypothetical protein